MLTEDRYSGILEIINRQGSATLAELCTMLNTSESTIRRDLIYLDEKGALVKVRGGARSNNDGTLAMIERNVGEKEKLFAEEKEKIAKYAASLIKSGDFVYIDAGTTTEKMIDYITETDAVFVTNGFVHGRKLAMKGLKVFVPAGEVKGTTEAIVGAASVLSLSEYNFTKSFLGANGISLEAGITTPDKREAEVKKAALKNSREVFFLADHSKFDRITAITFAPLSEGKIITDRLENQKYHAKAFVKEVL